MDEDEFTDVRLAERVAEGLPVAAMDRVVAAFTVKVKGKRAKLVPAAALPLFNHISASTVSRVKKGSGLRVQDSERVYEMGMVVDLVMSTFRGDTRKARAFMVRPHPMLEGKTPLQMVQSSSAGAAAVRSLLNRANAGVAV